MIPSTRPTRARDLDAALDGRDVRAARVAFDRLLAQHPLDRVLRDAVLPSARRLEAMPPGERDGIAGVLRAALLTLAEGWGRGRGPRALLGCVPGDRHDLTLICTGLLLRAHGWRITYLGPDLPLATLAELAVLLAPALVLINATDAAALGRVRPRLAELARISPLTLTGAAASPALAEGIGARYAAEDPVATAAYVG